MTRVLLEMEKTSGLHTGLGMFCYHLGKSLLARSVPDMEFGFYLPANRLDLFGSQELVIKQSPLHKMLFPSNILCDVWHCCHQDSPYFPGKDIPMVLTIHDLNFMQKYSGWRREYRKKKLGKMIDRASALVCISRQTGRHLEEVFGLSQEDYQVIYNGNCLSHFSGDEKSYYQRERPFLLCLGVLSPRKNAHVLCGMMAHIPEFDLILAGPPHSSYRLKIEEEARKHGVADRVIFAGEVDEEEKFRLYQNMEALVFPSLAEGFGLPVLEAMSMGKPVFLSRFGSLPEIGGEAAFYWDDFQPETMAQAVSSGMKRYDETGLEGILRSRAALFSWEKTAEDYIRLYQNTV
jgi:glycosyltransferase involved in cell wall biosynthesis